MCKHEVVVQKKIRVNPPVACKSFEVRFNVCDCGMTFATTKQRRKNRKNYYQAIRKFSQDNETHGIYY